MSFIVGAVYDRAPARLASPHEKCSAFFRVLVTHLLAAYGDSALHRIGPSEDSMAGALTQQTSYAGPSMSLTSEVMPHRSVFRQHNTVPVATWRTPELLTTRYCSARNKS